MKKIVILGCENSHANTFLQFIRDCNEFKDVMVAGVYSHDREASEKLSAEFGVKVMENYDEAVGQVDGVVVTARHGDNHYKYAKPYIESGVAMFIDKPVTISESDAVEFMKQCKENKVRITGGSCLKYADVIQNIKKDVINNEGGKTVSGVLRAPVSLDNQYGGFYFYSQHLAEMVTESFGRYPKSVIATRNGGLITVIFKYNEYDITGMFVESNYVYSALRFSETGESGGIFELVTENNNCFYNEFDEFYKILCGEQQKTTYKDFIAPVFVLNAIERSLASGKEEPVNAIEI